MKDVEVKMSTKGLFVVSIDGKKLTFTGDTATAKLKEGQEYTIQWFVRGEPGLKYKIEITKPKEARFNHSATLDKSKKDAGLFWFRVDAEAEADDADE